jgi:two-component system nitrogen regulation response regulator NtrX
MEHYLTQPLRVARAIFEKWYIECQIQKHEGNISRTAEFIGMDRTALHRKMRELEIDRE